MNKLVLVGVVTIVALAGCADSNDSLKKVNASLAEANDALSGTHSAPAKKSASPAASSVPVGKLGDGTGYQPVFNIIIPGDVCDKQAFIDGFKDTYIQYWNQFISSKSTLFSAQSLSQNKAEKQKAKKNLAFYKSREISIKKYRGHEMEYPMDLSSFYADNCPHLSYTEGQTAAIKAVLKDEDALEEQEL